MSNSNSNDVSEQSGSPRDSRNGDINNGLTVGSQIGEINVKNVDQNPTPSADHTVAPAQPAPRGETDQAGS
jgi:hypothetical protein